MRALAAAADAAAAAAADAADAAAAAACWTFQSRPEWLSFACTYTLSHTQCVRDRVTDTERQRETVRMCVCVCAVSCVRIWQTITVGAGEIGAKKREWGKT